jgi:SAM-dependent methyltransferase
MAQKEAWEREYEDPKLIQAGEEPRKDVRDYLRFLRRSECIPPVGLNILDLGSGTGKHSNHLASLGNSVVGLEISRKGIEIARTRAKALGVEVDYREASIGEKYPLENETFDLALDVMSSTTLSERERETYLKETKRVLKRGGYFFVRALCKDGDKNAKNLLKLRPGLEHDTYVHAELGLTERVFTERDFRELYSQYFEIQKLLKKTNYARFGGQSYKRNYWLAYLKKK